MAEVQIEGVIAAVLTPRNVDDTLDGTAMARLIEFLMQHRIFSFAVNGATGEFCLTRPEQLRAALCTVRSAAGGRATNTGG